MSTATLGKIIADSFLKKTVNWTSYLSYVSRLGYHRHVTSLGCFHGIISHPWIHRPELYVVFPLYMAECSKVLSVSWCLDTWSQQTAMLNLNHMIMVLIGHMIEHPLYSSQNVIAFSYHLIPKLLLGIILNLPYTLSITNIKIFNYSVIHIAYTSIFSVFIFCDSLEFPNLVSFHNLVSP